MSTIELTPRQRERLDAIKVECKEADPNLPEPSDTQIMGSLLDTWDAVGDGLYSGHPDESGKQLHLRVSDWHFRVSLTKEDSQP